MAAAIALAPGDRIALAPGDRTKQSPKFITLSCCSPGSTAAMAAEPSSVKVLSLRLRICRD